MNITIAIYSFDDNKVIVKTPFEIVQETDKCFFIEQGNRYLKSNIGKPMLKSATTYPYVEIIMIDADEETLKKELSKWFSNKALHVQKSNINKI
jgi:hypothetical protein